MAQGPEARARRVQRRDEVKARLRAAMVEAARDRPYSAITVGDITGTAGISRSTFYFYYRDKGELLTDAARAATARLFEDADRYWASDADPRRLVRDALSLAAATFSEHATLIRVTMEVTAFDERVGDFWRSSIQGLIDTIAERVRRDQAAGVVDAEVDPEPFTEALVTAAQGYLFRSIRRNGDAPEEAVDVLAEIWTRVLYRG